MNTRVGTAFLLTGGGAIATGFFMTGGTLVQPDYNGWRFVFFAGILSVSLGIVTLVLDPNTTREVITSVVLGVVGHLALSVTVAIAHGADAELAPTILYQVTPMAPMVLGYLLGAFRTLPETESRRTATILWGGSILSLVIWYLPFQVFVMTHDTTGESGFHLGFLFTFHTVLLLGTLIGAVFMYALWRAFGQPVPSELTPTA